MWTMKVTLWDDLKVGLNLLFPVSIIKTGFVFRAYVDPRIIILDTVTLPLFFGSLSSMLFTGLPFIGLVGTSIWLSFSKDQKRLHNTIIRYLTMLQSNSFSFLQTGQLFKHECL